MSSLTVRFWGVRGSVPAPLTPAQVSLKIQAVIAKAVGIAMRGQNRQRHPNDVYGEALKEMSFTDTSTYGGNTTCVEVRCDGDLIILDMGTGLRELGLDLMAETFANKGLRGTILQSHVHWDHIQGYPFWPQLYMPRTLVRNEFTFRGGLDWNRSLEEVLRGQMNPPVFPIEHRELEQTAMWMDFNTVYDGKEIKIPHSKGGEIRVLCRKLNHPQETYGYRIEYGGAVVAFCTDHEPFAGAAPHRPLVELAKDADLFITDCQYSHDEYCGIGGYKIQKMGWGHSFPEYIARVAQEAKAKRVVTTHHDPQASDERIEEIARAVEDMSRITTTPAYEGLKLDC